MKDKHNLDEFDLKRLAKFFKLLITIDKRKKEKVPSDSISTELDSRK